MEIMPGIHSLSAGAGAFMGLYAPNVYLIVVQEAALIDTGLGDPDVLARRLAYIKEKVQVKLKYIFITHSHPDHLGGVLFLKKALGAPLVAHRSEDGRIRKTLGSGLDRLVEDREQIAVGEWNIQVIHTPGHSPGHLCFFLQERGVLFSGDHIPGIGTTVVVPPRGDMSLYMDSLRRLGQMPLQMVCPGHGPLVKNPQGKIKELLQHRLEREAQLLNLLRTGWMEIKELIQEIYPELDHRLQVMARGQVLAHLIKLRREGRVEYQGLKWRRLDPIN